MRKKNKKRKWYYLHTRNTMTGATTMVAKVRSEGLANLIYARIKGAYDRNKLSELLPVSTKEKI